MKPIPLGIFPEHFMKIRWEIFTSRLLCDPMRNNNDDDNDDNDKDRRLLIVAF